MNKSKIAFLFPGQGSQYPGIGEDLYQQHAVVKQTYEQASDLLGYDIAELSFNDADDRIHLTRYTQPVLLTHCIACLRLFQQQTGERVVAAMAAGHSLGEYSALVSAGALSFEAGLNLVKTRGELMGEYGEGEMQALMLDFESAAALAQQHYCGIAACNLPQQNVVGGRAEDLDALTATMAEAFPRKRSARLKTEGAFHTYYMVEAATRFRAVLEEAVFNQPQIAVLSNFTGDNHDTDVASIKSRLFLQLFNPVLWCQNLLNARKHGANVFIEFGGGLGKGATAAEKRPNLESIVKKVFHAQQDDGQDGEEQAVEYHGVINAATLEQTVAHYLQHADGGNQD